MPEKKTFRVACAECGRTFFVHFELADPNAEGSADEKIKCQFCEKLFIVEIPAAYSKQSELIRSRKFEG